MATGYLIRGHRGRFLAVRFTRARNRKLAISTHVWEADPWYATRFEDPEVGARYLRARCPQVTFSIEETEE